jgi:hypothetical protein
MGTWVPILSGLPCLSWSAWKRLLRLRPVIGVGLMVLSYAVVNFILLSLYLSRRFLLYREAYEVLAMLDI